MQLTNITDLILYFSFTDGYSAFTNCSSGQTLCSAYVSTDSQSNILGWSISASAYPIADGLYLGNPAPSNCGGNTGIGCAEASFNASVATGYAGTGVSYCGSVGFCPAPQDQGFAGCRTNDISDYPLDVYNGPLCPISSGNALALNAGAPGSWVQH
jgi:hypothetical protein